MSEAQGPLHPHSTVSQGELLFPPNTAGQREALKKLSVASWWPFLQLHGLCLVGLSGTCGSGLGFLSCSHALWPSRLVLAYSHGLARGGLEAIQGQSPAGSLCLHRAPL